MFKKKQRLYKNKDIEAVFGQKKSSYNHLLGIKFVNNDLEFNRFTVIISTKVSKKAVERNRIKRIIKNTLKETNIKANPNVDCVFVVLKTAENIEKEKLVIATKELLKKTKLI